METSRFMVDEQPYACSDWKLKEKNLDFLRGVDARYFTYSVQGHMARIDTDDRHRAAISIRIAYSHAMEALFAFLAAMVQSPMCPLGWLLTYRNAELESVVRKVSNGSLEYFLLRERAFDWMSLSRIVHAQAGIDAAKKEWVQAGFGKLWARLAREFLDDRATAEYNSLKHGLRPRPGGVTVSMGAEPAPGVRAPPDAMKSIGGSEFGSTFFVFEALGKGRLNFRPRRHSRNWIPTGLASGTALIAMSIENVVSCLRIAAGDSPSECRFLNPASPGDFDAPWAFSPGVLSSSMDTIIREGDVQLSTKDDVVNSYTNAS